MEKIITLLGALFVSGSLFSQVGINTTTPSATLDVKVKDATNSQSLDGVIAPRLLGSQLSAKTYTSAQTGAIVYITDSSATLIGQTINVNSSGYYYFDGTVWKRMLTTVVNKGWQLADTAINSKVNQAMFIREFGGDAGPYQSVDNSELTVTVPPGYSENKVVLRWDLWGSSAPQNKTLTAEGTFRYFVSQEFNGNFPTVTSSIMMNGWVIAPIPSDGPRWSTPVVYSISNLPPGTYKFTLMVNRGEEINMFPWTPVTDPQVVKDIIMWGIQSKCDVYVK